MTDDIVGQGLELMLFGMGTVVVFLALLVVITSLMSSLIQRYFPETPALPAPQPSTAVAATVDTEVVAAITAAIQQHRSSNQ